MKWLSWRIQCSVCLSSSIEFRFKLHCCYCKDQLWKIILKIYCNSVFLFFFLSDSIYDSLKSSWYMLCKTCIYWNQSKRAYGRCFFDDKLLLLWCFCTRSLLSCKKNIYIYGRRFDILALRFSVWGSAGFSATVVITTEANYSMLLLFIANKLLLRLLHCF